MQERPRVGKYSYGVAETTPHAAQRRDVAIHHNKAITAVAKTHKAHSLDGTPLVAQARQSGPVAGTAACLGDIGTGLPPPKAPRVAFTKRIVAAYAGLCAEIDRVLTALQTNLSAGPSDTGAAVANAYETSAAAPQQAIGAVGAVGTVKAVDAISAVDAVKAIAAVDAIEAIAAVDADEETEGAKAHAAAGAGRQILKQFACLNSQESFVAFMRLRLQGDTSHLRIAGVMNDMATRLRRYCLDQHTTYNLQAETQQNKAIRWQHIKGVMGSSLGALSASLNIGIATMFVSSGAGLALTGAAIVVGFGGAGALGGARQNTSFDWNAAFQGASAGAAIIPAGQALGLLVSALEGYLGTTVIVSGAQTIGRLAPEVVVQQFNRFYADVAGQAAMLAPAELKWKTTLELLGTTATLVSKTAVLGLDGLIAMRTLDAQRATLLGQMCSHAAKIAQTNGENTTNFLSTLQENRMDAMKQIETIMTLHDQWLAKAARRIA